MKHLYPYLLSRLGLPLCLVLVACATALAQCPDGTTTPTNPSFFRTVDVSSGFTSTQVKFKQIDPTQGMITCVNLCVRVRSVITVSIENLDVNGSLTLPFVFSRSDNITGPGLGSGLTNNVSNLMPYGAITMQPNDGAPGSGPDYFGRTNNVIIDQVICRNITDAALLSDFYGLDSVAFDYNIVASTGVAGGGNFSFVVSTQARADFVMSYCVCPAVVLPINVYAFDVSKTQPDKAQLQWSGYDDAGNYKYVPEVSRDGRTFTALGSVAKNQAGAAPYTTSYKATSGSGMYYFRIRQVYSNGYTRFSNIRQIELENSGGPKFSVYPNPSTGIVGIKFDNIRGGRYSLKIFNSLGQAVVTKDLSMNSSSYNQVAQLKTGAYWIRLTDKDTNESSVSQIVIK